TTIPSEVQSRVAADKKVVIVSPKVEVVHYYFDFHGERLKSEEAEIARELSSTIEQELSQRGFDVKPAPSDSAATTELALVFDQVSYLYDAEALPAKWDNSFFQRRVSTEQYLAPDYDHLRRVDECDKIAATIGVDALVFVELQQWKRSLGLT